jgi:flagellar biosynthesis protein FliR
MFAVANLAIYSSTELMVAAIALSAPAIVALLLADLVLGAIARMAQQVPVYFVGMPLKGLAGIGILLVGMGGVETAIVGGFRNWMVIIERAFAVWR